MIARLIELRLHQAKHLKDAYLIEIGFDANFDILF
jgi:hypothetical protein